jgi:predicted PurR-regulated permease PerM
LIVAAVALVVQQLDNELLAPWIYGKSLQLHPLVILLGITAGTTLFGFVGALLAVPTIAVTLNVIDEARNPTIDRNDARADLSPPG